MSKSRGFTLIELVLVVAVIVIIAAIAIPQILRSRLTAEEASAIGSLRTINTVQVQIIATSQFPDPTTGVAMYASFEQLSSLNPPPLDDVLAGGTNIKSGYEFTIDLATQTPEVPDYTAYGLQILSGNNLKNMLIDPSGLIHFTTDGTIPNISSPTLQ